MAGEDGWSNVNDGHVGRDFRVTRSACSDCQHHQARTRQGGVYLCAVTDLASNRIVGDAIDIHVTSETPVNAVRTAIPLRGRPGGTIASSDWAVRLVPVSPCC